MYGGSKNRSGFGPFHAQFQALWLSCYIFLFSAGIAWPVPAQSQVQTPVQIGALVLAFDIEIRAPQAIQDYLQRHIELSRYRELTDLDATELDRLLKAAQSNVQDLLGTLGYFSPEVQITAVDTPQNPLARRRVLINVVAGEPVKISEVTIDFTGPVSTDGAPQAQRQTIRASWPLRPGMTFTQVNWDAAKVRALQLLTQRLYALGQITSSRAEIDPDLKIAHLTLTLDSGAPFRLGPLQVTGTEHYDLQLVSRLARLSPGADYDQGKLLEAQQRLSDSGFFDSVFLSLDTAGNPDAAPVLVQLRDAKLQKIVLGVGASTDSGLRLSMDHTHNRVPGLGWRAVTKLSLDRETRSLGSELTSPPDDSGTRWVTSALFKNQLSGSFDVSSQRYRIGRNQPGDQIDRNYYLQFDRAEANAAGLSSTADSVSVNYAWTKRSFDSLPFPSSGYGLGAEVGGGVALGSTRQPYLRAQARWLGIWPLANEALQFGGGLRSGRIAVRAEGGAVLARDGVEIPSTQLFVTGGDSSVRGYALRTIGTELANGVVAAGRYLAVGSVEWQRPIVVNDRVTDWESTLFLDAGAVADRPSDLEPKFGVGAGVRWRSPVGPLQIDVAYGLAVKEFRLHLSVGFTF